MGIVMKGKKNQRACPPAVFSLLREYIATYLFPLSKLY